MTTSCEAETSAESAEPRPLSQPIGTLRSTPFHSDGETATAAVVVAFAAAVIARASRWTRAMGIALPQNIIRCGIVPSAPETEAISASRADILRRRTRYMMSKCGLVSRTHYRGTLVYLYSFT